MTEQMQARLAELRREYETGQRQLQELMMQEVTIRETLLRISGAIQVLEELTTAAASGASAGPPAIGPESGDEPEVMAQPASGTVVSVG